MQTEPRIVFDDIPVDEHARDVVASHIVELERFYDHITSCRVVIALPHRHHGSGKLYSVRIDLVVPGGQIVVNRDHHENHAHEDLLVAIRDSFDAARRRLEDHARRLRGVQKIHATRTEGFVARLFPLQGYGFIETPDGREIYFHRNAVLNDDFDRIEPGWQVDFTEESGDEGPQASSVWVVHVGSRAKVHEAPQAQPGKRAPS